MKKASKEISKERAVGRLCATGIPIETGCPVQWNRIDANMHGERPDSIKNSQKIQVGKDGLTVGRAKISILSLLPDMNLGGEQ